MLIKAISEYCKEQGIRFMLVVIDIPSYIPDVEREFVAIDPTFNSNFFEDDLRDYAKVLNIEYLGLQRVFRKSYEVREVPLHWTHWNYEGHGVVANALANKVGSIIF